jgi:hypothetical protein
MIFCGGVNGPCKEGKPIKKNAIANLVGEMSDGSAWREAVQGDSHDPRQRQDIERRPHTEQDVPEERSNKEDGSNDIQIGVRLGVVTGQQGQLERSL